MTDPLFGTSPPAEIRPDTTATIEEELDQYAAYKRTDKTTYEKWARKMHRLSLRWQMEGRTGSFLEYAAHHTGLGRTTIWRDVQSGTALEAGVIPADQSQLLTAQECLKNGATPDQVNEAISNGGTAALEELRAQVDTGTTVRRLTVQNATKFDRVRTLLGTEYRIPAPRLERDEIMFDLTLYLHEHHPHVIKAFVDASVQGNQR